MEGLITVEGGKFTTSRNLAEKAVDLAEKKLKKRRAASPTAKRYLWGSRYHDMRELILDTKHKNRDFRSTALRVSRQELRRRIARRFWIPARQDSELAEALNPDGELLAQVVYAVKRDGKNLERYRAARHQPSETRARMCSKKRQKQPAKSSAGMRQGSRENCRIPARPFSSLPYKHKII